MKKQVLISVQNISNDHVHFKRCIEQDDSIRIPYDSIVQTLLYLFNGLNVKVVIEQSQPFEV